MADPRGLDFELTNSSFKELEYILHEDHYSAEDLAVIWKGVVDKITLEKKIRNRNKNPE